jgi:hypothetical protein
MWRQNFQEVSVKHFIKYGLLVVSALFIASCGGGGGATNSPSAQQLSVAARTLASVPVGSCPNGGITVVSGIDINGNGVLDTSEGNNAQYVCNGVDGVDGFTSLVSITAEVAGANCSDGGSKVSAGLDLNSNSTLDAIEVTSNSYICNGTNVTNGSTSLLKIVIEPVGANCADGGNKITSGLDSNANSLLDSAEVTSTAYVCNVSSGLPTAYVTDGAVLGAMVILDINDDRICDSNEPNTFTDGNGGFSFPPSLGQHMTCASGGVDVATLKPFIGQLKAPPGASQITPLTTLVMASLDSNVPPPVVGVASAPLPSSVAKATTAIATKLGLIGVDLLTVNPVALASSTPKLIQTGFAIETLLEQTAASLGVASGGSGFSTNSYAKAVQGLVQALATATTALDLSNTSSVKALVSSTLSNTAKITSSNLLPDHVAALSTDLISNLVQAVGMIPATQYAVTGGAIEVASTISEFTNLNLSLIVNNRSSLTKPTSLFGCTTCLSTTDLSFLGSSTVGLAASVIPNANALILDLTTLKVNGNLVTSYSNFSLQSIDITGNVSTVSMKVSGSPVTATASAAITVTGPGGGQTQLVIDTINVSTVNGLPFISVPSSAKLYAYRRGSDGGGGATFSNINNLLRTTNGIVTIDMAGLLALNIGGLGTNSLFNGQYRVSFGIKGVPVALKTAAGTALPAVKTASLTSYGLHQSLGTDLMIFSSTAKAPTALHSAALNLNMPSLTVNGLALTTTSGSSTPSVTLTGPMTQVSIQTAGAPVTATGSALVTVQRNNWPYSKVQLLIDQVNVSTVKDKPKLTVPLTAKLYAYYSRNRSNLQYATFSNVSSLLVTDANGLVNLNMGSLLALVKSMDPARTADINTVGTLDVNLTVSGIPLTLSTPHETLNAPSSSSSLSGYGTISGQGLSFSVIVQ